MATDGLLAFITQPWMIVLIAVVVVVVLAFALSRIPGLRRSLRGSAPPAGPPLSLLLITLDTMRADGLSCYGGPAPTPNLDRLAAGGLTYTTHLPLWSVEPSTPLTPVRLGSVEAVIQTILHVARKFPIIRFDAAMTLAKRHYQRLWFPEPGSGGDIPSRAEHGLTKEDVEKVLCKFICSTSKPMSPGRAMPRMALRFAPSP